MTDICKAVWFQIADKGWRPFLGWGLALPTSFYAFRAVLGLPFDIAVFLTLAGAAAAPYGARAFEKHQARKAGGEDA